MTQNIYNITCPPQSSSASLDPQNSPPSPIYSDFSEDLEDGMECSTRREDANAVLQKVLGLLDQVVEHLRDKNENDAANNIAKQTLNIISTFNNATAPWDIDTFLINPRTVHRPNPTLSNAGPLTSTGGSWASVAAKPVNGKNHLIKFHPSDGIVRKYIEEEIKETDSDARVIWVQGWDQTRPLSMITERVHQGPLFSMVYSEEYAAICLIFQYADSARGLLAQDAYHRDTEGYSLFGRGCTLIPGLGYTENDDIRRMSPPVNERRRLTFARSQLFAHGMTEEQFKSDIYGLVGESNVELVWLFNTGNATVVFSSTAIARLVRDDFRKKARLPGPYQNVHVSFSHDPCEKPMNLITQIPGAGENKDSRSRSDSTRTQLNVSGLGMGLSRRDSKRKQVVDADGWQTVGKKR